jgi:hypothetical protein
MRRTFILSAKPFNCFFSIKNKLLSVKSSFKMEEGRFAKRIGLVEVSKPTGVITHPDLARRIFELKIAKLNNKTKKSINLRVLYHDQFNLV